MNAIGVIPARYLSSRFEGKVLADILGKPMIQHVWERARQAKLLDDVIIACDDERVAQSAAAFGAKIVMTAKGHSCGTDRIIEVVNPLDVRVVINIQADEPLVHPLMIDTLVQALASDRNLSMATLMKKIADPREIEDPHVVKVVVDKNNFALYFSRAAIPHKAVNSEVASATCYKHIGLYGYTKDFLFVYRNLAVSGLEKTEKLEQLRVLEEGYRIKVIETKYDTIGVDTAEDLERLKNYLQQHKG
jgi:3-deoxy-manno-octulosonate cytidylyltransferase (CMP-KDO synthetase)